MNAQQTVRAWKDPDYRATNGGPGSPAGEIVIEPFGGSDANTEILISYGCCSGVCTYQNLCPETPAGSCGGLTIGCCYPTTV